MKMSANYYFSNARRKDLARRVQVTGELLRSNTSIYVALRMPLNRLLAVREYLVEAGPLPVSRRSPQSPCRSHKLVPLPWRLFGNPMVAFETGSQE